MSDAAAWSHAPAEGSRPKGASEYGADRLSVVNVPSDASTTAVLVELATEMIGVKPTRNITNGTAGTDATDHIRTYPVAVPMSNRSSHAEVAEVIPPVAGEVQRARQSKLISN